MSEPEIANQSDYLNYQRHDFAYANYCNYNYNNYHFNIIIIIIFVIIRSALIAVPHSVE